MKIRRGLATLATAGILVTGAGVTAASAETVVPSAPAPCAHAPATLAALRTQRAKLTTRLDKLKAAQAAAVAAGHPDQARRLQHQVNELTKATARLDARIAKLQKACS